MARSVAMGDAARRAASSWLALAVALAALAAIGLLASARLGDQIHRQAVSEAIEAAETVTRLTALRVVDPADLTHSLTERERADLDGDVDQLARGGYLLGFEIWQQKGQLLYQRGVSLSASVHDQGFRRLSAGGHPLVHFFMSAPAPEAVHPVDAVEVALPFHFGAGRDGVLVGLVLRADPFVSRSGWASGLLTGAVAVLLALAAVGMVLLRKRFRSREFHAQHDTLTGLGNRALLECYGPDVLRAGRPACLLLMDLDGFKRVNDTLGHAAGDELLHQVSEELLANTRAGDLLVRLGGDEFAALLPGISGAAAQRAAQRMLVAVEREYVVKGVTVDSEASVGFAVAPDDGTTIGRLLQAADIAMYQAKRGKLGVARYSPADSKVDADDLQLLVELRGALSRGELTLHYQPALAVKPGIDGFVEALVRWNHPLRGLMAPSRFIPLAEDTALIHPLTAWVLEEAIAQCARWRLDGVKVRVAVNISPRSLTHPGLVELVTDVLARHQLPAEALHLEITESAILVHPEVARDILVRLQQRGVSLSIDDFGAGFTSLAHFKTLPVELLKIDRAFVSDLLVDQANHAIVSSVVQLGHSLGIRVVAEGVEDAATLRQLEALGCDLVQGFHVSRPMAPVEATAWLRAHPQCAVVRSGSRG